MHIRTESKDRVLVWQIHRPERRNALGTILSQELWEKVKHLQNEMSAWRKSDTAEPAPYHCLVLKATVAPGPHPIWIAGGDLHELNELQTIEAGRAFAERMARVCHSLQNLPIPVIAVIDGLVIGGAIEFALAADIRLCTDRSAFHFKQLELGLATIFVSSQRLVRTLGISRATDCLFRRRLVDAKQALDWGLAHEVAADSEALEVLLQKTLTDMRDLDSRSMAAQKEMLLGAAMDEESFQKELDLFSSLWMKAPHKARMEAFKARKPHPR